MVPSQWSQRRGVFGAAVEDYDAARPGYPEDAVVWCLGEPVGTVTVVDLGAGTGKLTRTLLDLGHRVIAIEPDRVMLKRLRTNLGDHEKLTTIIGSAEKLSVDDEAADAVIAGQAFHWFESDLALPEMRRVVRGGGYVAAIWNTRDESHPWVEQMSRILGEAGDNTHGATGRNVLGEVDFGPGFSPVEESRHHHVQHLDRSAVRSLALSRSYTINLPEGEKRHMLDSLDQLLTSSFGGDGLVPLPYVVECFRARRR